VSSSRRLAWALAATIALAYLITTPWTTLWDRDEARFGRAALEMVSSGRVLYPTFGGELRPQKPVFIYWLMSLSIIVLGHSEVAVRIWSPFGLAVAALLTFEIAARLFTARIGLLAMVVVAANPLAFVEGTIATTDAVLLAALTAAMLAWFEMLSLKPTARNVAVLGAALTVAQFTKGPAAAAIFLSGASATLAFGRPLVRDWRRLSGGVAAAVAGSAALFVAWATQVEAITGGRYFEAALGRELVTRALSPKEGHGGSLLWFIPFYPAVVAIGFFPWAAFLPAGWREVRRWSRKTAANGSAGPWAVPFLAGWILGPLVIFTAAATKLPHYILPIWPPLAIGVATFLDAVLAGDAQVERALELRRGFRFIAVPLAGVAVLLFGAAGLVPGAGLPIACMAVAATTAISVLGTWIAVAGGPVKRPIPWLIGGTTAVHLMVALVLLPPVEAFKPSPRLAAVVQQRTDAATPVATLGYDEPSLDYYLGTRTPVRLDSTDGGRAWLRKPGERVLVTTAAYWATLEPDALEDGACVLASAAGLNYSKGEALELVAVLSGRPACAAR
jgi:4-amino-4-deoxy-L-arabinose transferase-like glycosyltransferase